MDCFEPPPESPDLEPSDYHLFTSSHVHQWKRSDKEVELEVKKWAKIFAAKIEA